MEIVNPKSLKKEELEAQISKTNYYIASNKERNNLDRVQELEEYKQELKAELNGKI